MKPMAKTLSLQTAIKQFKRRTRKVAMRCTQKEEDWHLQTCEGRRNRMEELAISNKHAGVRGIPQLDEEQSKTVTSAVFAMRGDGSKSRHTRTVT